MSRILFAGEFDGSREGLAAQAEIAADLAESGMQSVFAVRSMALANAVLPASKYGVLQAPSHFLMPPFVAEPRNYVDVLINRGFAHPHLLAALAGAWLGTIQVARPSLLVVCGSPDALLAARLAGLPVIQLSRGFDIPPATDPMPVLRPWVEQSSSQRRTDEALVLGNINALLAARKRQPLSALHQLFASEARLVATLPELDPFGPRKNCIYAGPLSVTAHGRRLAWPAAAKRRVLVHFRQLPQSNMKAVSTILGALVRHDSATVVLLPGGSAGAVQPGYLTRGTMSRIYRGEVDWSGLLPDADACIFDGDSQVAACCALAGVPLVCTPPSVEGFLLAGRMIKAGIGAGVGLIAPNIRGRLKATLKEFATGGEEVRAVRALASLRAHLGDREAFLNIVKLIVLLGFTRTLNRRSEPLSTRVRKA